MTRIVLRWLRRAVKRSHSTFSFRGNNIFYTAVALMFMLDPPAAGILLMIMGLVVVLPMSSDPLRAIPLSRSRIWPLKDKDRRLLRLVSPWLNPMTWAIVGFAIAKRASWGLVALAAGVVATGFVTSARSSGRTTRARWIPQFPSAMNHLIRKNLREMISTLDFCAGGLIAVASLGWRAGGLLPQAAFFPLTAVAMLAISTCALTLFGLDGAAGLTRYRLLPVRGWQILLAKDVAYLLIALLVALPLYIPGAMGAALIALAVGNRTSVRTPSPQMRWRFQTGQSFGDAISQIIAMIMAGAAVAYSSLWFLPLFVAAWAVSVWWFGREIDRDGR